MKDHFSKSFIYEHELMLYPYAPLGILHNQGEWPEPLYQFGIVVFIHQDDDSIIEWINYHKNIGFNHIYIYYDGDEPLEFYRRILPFMDKSKGFVTFHYYQFKNTPQSLYFHFIRNHSHETKWHLILDNNDILYLNNNDVLYLHEKKTIADFVKTFPNVDAIYFNLLLYGYQNDNSNFYHTNEVLKNKPQASQLTFFTRMLVRSQIYPYQEAFENIHSPIFYYIQHLYPDAVTKNVLHEDMQDYHQNLFNNQIYINDYKRKNLILNTAYCLRFDSFLNQQSTPNILEQCDQFYFKAISNNANHIENEDFQRQTNAIKQNYLQPFQQKQIRKVENYAIFPKENYPLISYNKPCQQSSAPQEISPTTMAINLVSNKLSGKTQAVTLKENNPWWLIDLEQSSIIYEIRLFHGLDYTINIMTNFMIESSSDKHNWILRYEKKDTSLFGGVDGHFIKKDFPLGFHAQWIRLIVPGVQKIFSLDQVQIFGQSIK